LKHICKPFSSSAYESIDNNRLALYAIKTLQVNRIPVTQETVAVALFLSFPQKFSLVGFEQFPDAERAHRTLLQLGPKWRNWATGDTHHGYSLNESGEAEFRRVEEALKNPSKSTIVPRQRAKKPRTRDPNQEIKEIEETSLFKEYVAGERHDFSEFAIWELLKSYPYAPRAALRGRIDAMLESARFAERKDMVKFLKWVRDSFSNVFSS
jgi:hypothetical protein